MKHKIFVLAAMCLLINHLLFAQNKVYSLEEVWQKTLHQYPSLSSKKELVERQKLNRELVKLQSLPEVNVQTQQSYGSYQTVPGSFFPLPGLYNTSGSSKNSSNAGNGFNLYASAVLQWNFMQFGRVKKKIKVADAGLQLSKAALLQEEFKLQALSTRYYFALLQSSALLTLFKADAKRLYDLMDLLKAQADAGLLPGADTLLIKSAFLQAKNKINEERALLQSAQLQLAALMGEDADKVLIDTSVYYRFKPDGILMNESLQNHPYLQYVNASINYSNAELAAIKKEPYPSVGLLAGTGIRGSGIDPAGNVNKNISAPWNNNVGSYLAGIGITWNLSSLYQNKTRQRIADRKISSIKADYDAAKLQLNTWAASAAAGWKEQHEKVKDAQLAFEASQKAYELYTVRYESGLINLIELLQLQSNLQEAERNYVTAIHSYWNELINQSEAFGNLNLLLSAIHP